MMKKIALLSAAVMMAGAVNVSAEDVVTILVDNRPVEGLEPAYVENGRAMVPMRAIFEALGAEVSWDGDNAEVTAVKDDKTIKLTIGDSVLYRNNTSVKLDSPAVIKGEGTTMVPARAVSEALDADVEWDEKTYTVYVDSEPKAEKTEKYDSLEALSKAVGFEVTLPDNAKDKAEFETAGEGEDIVAQIRYTNEKGKSVAFRMKKGNEDISGIENADYESTMYELKTKTDIYSRHDTYYASWSDVKDGDVYCYAYIVKGYSRDDFEKELIGQFAKTDKTCAVLLDSNATTGYSWSAKVYKEDIAQIENDEYIPYIADKGIVGSGGIQRFTIKGIKQGETDITFTYSRGEETDAAKTVTKTIRVDENGDAAIVNGDKTDKVSE